MIDFADAQVETVTFEVRYEPALLLWDRAGAAWQDVLRQFPELKSQNANPAQQTFESKDLRAVVELEALRVISRGENAEKRAAEVGQVLMDSCSDRFGISVFNRVGFREIRARKFPNKEQAFDHLKNFVPPSLLSSAIPDSRQTAFVFSTRSEGESTGLLATLRVESRETKIQIPWEFQGKMTDVLPKEHVILFDTDYYTTGATRREALRVEDWMRQANRMANKQWKGLVG